MPKTQIRLVGYHPNSDAILYRGAVPLQFMSYECPETGNKARFLSHRRTLARELFDKFIKAEAEPVVTQFYHHRDVIGNDIYYFCCHVSTRDRLSNGLVPFDWNRGRLAAPALGYRHNPGELDEETGLPGLQVFELRALMAGSHRNLE
jgi:hypothetical protein